MLKCKPFTIRVDCCVILLIMLGFIDAQFLIELIKVPNIGETEWDVVTTCSASDATFGGSVTDFIDSHENLGSVSPVVPADACSPISVEKWKSKGNDFAAVSRSPPEHPCKFSEQAFNVQNSTYNFKLIIFYNYPGEDPITMNGAKYKNLINLPIVMISHSCMNIISSHNPEKYKVRVRAASTASEILRYLIPIIVVLAFCLVLFLITVCIRTCIERRRLNRRRLSKRNLKKIPVKKYREGDEPDSCAICIENFVPGEKLRHLPCRHIFHCSCVDVWLTKSRKVCPLCKRKIGSDSDSDGSIDENIRSAPTSSTTLNNGETTSASSGQSSSRARTPVTWSSQEALVEREVVFETNQGLGVSGYMRRALQFFRRNRNNHSDDAEPGYHVPDDGDHLLEEEA